MNGVDSAHQVRRGLMWVPAKYSCPGSPISFGEQVKVWKYTLFRPAQISWSKEGFWACQIRSFQCGPMVVKDSAPTILRP